MSNWIPALGYDVALIDNEALVLIRGDCYEPSFGAPAWRKFAVAVDLNDARTIANALNQQLQAKQAKETPA